MAIKNRGSYLTIVAERVKRAYFSIFYMKLLIIIALAGCILLAGCSPSLGVTSTGAAIASGDWCLAGSSYSQGSIESSIEGLTSFKGNTYCKADASISAEGQTITYSYYFTEEGDDVWVVVNANGEVTETHVQG
jgi:hypothetical protein